MVEIRLTPGHGGDATTLTQRRPLGATIARYRVTRETGGSGGEETTPSDPDSARVAVDRAFIDAVRGDADDIRVPYAEALRTHELAVRIAEAARRTELGHRS